MKKTIVLFFLFMLFASFACLAEEEAGKKPPDMFGLGVLVSDSVYKGVDRNVWPMPLVFVRKGKISIKSVKAEYIFLEDKSREANFFIIPRFMGYDSKDSSDLDGMKDRKWSLDGGMEYSITMPYFYDSKASVSITQDLLAKSGGQEARLWLKRKFDFRPFFIRPGVGIVWQSRKMADYYFGVKDFEQKLGRPSYNLGASINYDLSADAFLFFSRNWALFSRSDFLFYDHGIKSSPIVRKGRSNSFILGIVYVF
ncbi:MAG: MipA/OmpV family protein [Candidatus Omnitrophica bacterium]|nr:MipA/OmpV family protein [Candidatus Omnitrophota bacterium]